MHIMDVNVANTLVTDISWDGTDTPRPKDKGAHSFEIHKGTPIVIYTNGAKIVLKIDKYGNPKWINENKKPSRLKSFLEWVAVIGGCLGALFLGFWS